MAGLDFHAIDLEAHASFGVNAVASVEIRIFHRVDPVRIGRQKPGSAPAAGIRRGSLIGSNRPANALTPATALGVVAVTFLRASTDRLPGGVIR